MSIIKSIKGLFGQMIHYKDGVKVGETWDGLISGTKNHYNADGTYMGSSAKGFLADEVHYDPHGRYVGESWKDDFGTTRHYNDSGRAGTSYEGIIGTTSVFDHQDTSDVYENKSVFEERESIFNGPKSIFEEPKSIFDDADSDDDSFDFEDPDW